MMAPHPSISFLFSLLILPTPYPFFPFLTNERPLLLKTSRGPKYGRRLSEEIERIEKEEEERRGNKVETLHRSLFGVLRATVG